MYNKNWYSTIIEIFSIDRSWMFANKILTFRCRYSWRCWDDWPTPVCAGAIGHAKAWAQLYTAAWICPSGGPFFSACDLDRARLHPGSRILLEASHVTNWSIAATQNIPAPIRMHEASRRYLIDTDGARIKMLHAIYVDFSFRLLYIQKYTV